MHPLAAPGTLWVLSSDGKYLVRPQADETSRKKQISCGRQGKGLPCFSLFRRGFRLCGGDQRAFRSPFGNLRVPLQQKGVREEQLFCGRQGKEPSLLEGFASAEATKGLSDRPLDPFGEFLSQTEPYPSAVFMHIGQKIPNQQTNLPCPISCITLVKI